MPSARHKYAIKRMFIQTFGFLSSTIQLIKEIFPIGILIITGLSAIISIIIYLTILDHIKVEADIGNLPIALQMSKYIFYASGTSAVIFWIAEWYRRLANEFDDMHKENIDNL